MFGRQLLTDDQVLGHLRTSLKIQTPYGLRVISKADGSLLPGHSGEYVYGGSWFLCDAANYLVAAAHGLPAAEAEQLLITRIEKELAHVRRFTSRSAPSPANRTDTFFIPGTRAIGGCEKNSAKG